MFTFAILIGIYSYIIFFTGVFGVLYRQNIIVITIMFLAIAVYLFREKLKINLLKAFKTLKIFNFAFIERNFLFCSFLILIILQAGVNLIGAIGPELAFDALWYHLTLPKIYLQNHSIDYISGGLLYYSAMPKLGEMLYTAALLLHTEILAKIIHLTFGILTSIAIFAMARNYLSPLFSLLAVLIFYTNLVVAWQSTTAYIDLIRTFFEFLTLWGFINWVEKKEVKWLVASSIMIGLSITTKLLAIGSLVIFSFLIIWVYFQKIKPTRPVLMITSILVYWCIALLIPLPWFIFSFLNTGNPIYPFFTNVYPISINSDLLNLKHLISDIWIFFTSLPDPISLIYILLIPFLITSFKKFPYAIKLITLYSLLAIIFWYITPRTGGGRFILPYLPAFSFIAAIVISQFKTYRLVLISVVIFVALTTIIYRGAANLKYVPVLIGKTSKQEFLAKNLNFGFGDFYDTDNYFSRNISGKDRVFLYGFHNLYYINFPFIDSSWVKKGDKFTHVATQGVKIPDRFKDWNLIYENDTTGVKLYSKGGRFWEY